MDIRATLTHPIGPLPLWGWGAIGAGGVIFYAARRGNPVAQAVTDPNTAFPAPPGLTQPTDTTGGSTGTDFPPQVIGAGQQYVQAGAPALTLADIIGGGSLPDFITKLGPNYQSFGLNAGDAGVNVTHQAQNQIDEASYQAQLLNGQALQGMQYANAQATQQEADQTQLAQGALTITAAQAQYAAQQQSSIINYGNIMAQQALMQGSPFQYNSSGFQYNPFAPSVTTGPVSAGGGAVAPISGGQCNTGNFSCVRYACNRGDFNCARSVAPWITGKESQLGW